MATTAGFPIIGAPTVWTEWNNYGAGAWNMWFMAPYGEWVYSAFVKSNVAYFRKINVGGVDADYPISTWEFDLAAGDEGPDTVFPYEKNEGYPNGSMGLGCIRGADPKLYLAGRSTGGTATDTIIERFSLADNFAVDAFGTIPLDEVGDPMNINRLCGIEVDAGNAIYLVTNNNNHSGTKEFILWKYAYTWDDAGHSATITKDLSPTYLTNNAAARIRGIAIAGDGNVLIFANTGDSSTECKAFKFNKTTLAFMGSASWTPNISTSTWAYTMLHGNVFLYFQGLDSASSSYDWRTAVYYDRATGMPNADKSNFIIHENLTIFASDDPIELSYHARDSFNIAVVGANTKFYIASEDPDDESTWTDRVGAIMPNSGDTFFNPDDTPIETSATTVTDGDGVATAYYKPMKSGSGTERDAIAIKCPSDS